MACGKPELAVEWAATGFEALQRLSLAPVHVVIMHLDLPLMSGVEVVRQINRIGTRMLVILYASPLPVELAAAVLYSRDGELSAECILLGIAAEGRYS